MDRRDDGIPAMSLTELAALLTVPNAALLTIWINRLEASLRHTRPMRIL
jgi:hypothetical protein